MTFIPQGNIQKSPLGGECRSFWCRTKDRHTAQKEFSLEFFSKCEDLWHLLITPVYIFILHVYICPHFSFLLWVFPTFQDINSFLTSTKEEGGSRVGVRVRVTVRGREVCVRACSCVFVLPGPFCHSSTSNPPEGDIVAVMNTDSCFLHWDLSSVQIFGCRCFQRFKRVFDEIMQTWRPLKRQKLGSEHVVPVTASVLSTVQNSC